MVRSGARRGADRGGAVAHAVALFGPGHVPRRQPAAPQRQLAGGDPAHAHRPAEPDRGGQGQPGRGRFLRAPCRQEPAQEIRGPGPGGQHRRRVPNFWVRRDDSGSKFANFDDGRSRVAANGSAVDLGRNEATLVRSGRHPSEKVGILGAVELWHPRTTSSTSSAEADLRWAPVPDAVGYWLELAHDHGFQRMAISRWGLEETTLSHRPARDRELLLADRGPGQIRPPGARGEVWRFHVRVDQMPPFLTFIASPRKALILTGPSGSRARPRRTPRCPWTAPSWRSTGKAGSEPSHQPKPGLDRLVLEATDAAGNRTERRARSLMPAGRAGGPALRRRHPAAGAAPLRHRPRRDLAHRSHPRLRNLISLRPGTATCSPTPTARGGFTLNVPLPAADNEFVVDVVQRSGFTTRTGLSDGRPTRRRSGWTCCPRPRRRSNGWGCAAGRRWRRALDQRPAARLIGDEFDETVTLTGGNNPIELVATDPVGNAASRGSRSTSIRRRPS